MSFLIDECLAGLVILSPAVNRAAQRRLFPSRDEIAIIGEPVNRMLEIALEGDEVTLTLYDLPSTTFKS